MYTEVTYCRRILILPMDKVNGLLYAESSSIILCLPARDSVMCSEMHQQDILTTFKTSDDVRHVED